MLKKKYRFFKEREIEKIFKKGEAFFSGPLGIKVYNNNLSFSRMGVLVGKKFSKKAVERNKVKRQIATIFQDFWETIKPGIDIIVFLKKDSQELPPQDLRKVILELLKKAKVFEDVQKNNIKIN